MVPVSTIRYQKEFVDGVLKGMTFVDAIRYPKSEISRHLASFQIDVETGRVFRGLGSSYVITSAELI